MDCKEVRMLKNWCLWTVVLEKMPQSPLDGKEIKPVNLKGNQPWILAGKTCWSWSSSILVLLWEQPTHWKSPWCWERLRAEGEEGIRGWDGWMASPMQWTWTWANFGRWGGTGRPGMLQSMGSPRVRHDWVTEQQQSCKEIKPINPKRNQPWTFIGKTDPEAEAPMLWQPDAKSWLTGKDPDAGKDWGQEEKGMTEDEMAG